MVGTLKIKGKNNESRLIFVDHESRKNWFIFPGQYVYLSVEDARIPVCPVLSAKEKMVFRRASGDGSG